MMGSKRRPVVAFLLAMWAPWLPPLAAPLHAQHSLDRERAADDGVPAWMLAWSPLGPVADAPRRLPRAPAAPSLLTAPAPHVGLLWTAGNPAALPAEVGAPRSEMRVVLGRDAGPYRRPLDPDDVSARLVSAVAWRPVGRRAAAIGRVAVGEEALGDAAAAPVLEPHGSNPLVLTDTSSPAARRVRARLEGAVGSRVGGWALGLAAGIATRDHRTEEARFPRLARVATPGVSVGVARALPTARLRAVRVGALWRWTGESETVNLVPEPGVGTVYQLEGYGEPDPRVVSQAPPYYRRMERDGRALGLAAAGTIRRLGGAEWAVLAEWTRRREDQFSEQREDPAEDRWRADGDALGAALRAPLGRRALVGVRVRYETLDGAATRADLEGDIFRAREVRLGAAVEARYASGDSAWLVAAAGLVGRERRTRRDFLARLHSDVDQWTPGGAVEVARRLSERVSVSAGYAASLTSTVSAIPNATRLGPVYQRLVAPELSLYAARTAPRAATVVLRYRRSGGAALWLRGRHEVLSARGAGGATLPFAPQGTRTLWTVSAGISAGG